MILVQALWKKSRKRLELAQHVVYVPIVSNVLSITSLQNATINLYPRKERIRMEKKNYKIDIKPFTVHDSTDDYDDDNIPEVDLPKTTDVIPDQKSCRNGLDDE